MDVTSVEAFTAASVEVTSVGAFTEDFVEVSSVEGPIASMEAMKASVEAVEASMNGSDGSFHGSFHELQPKMQIVQTARTNARMGRVDRNWTKSGGRLFSHARGFC